ncbi:cysteine--tRNA ligase [Striga asiatica]|uniref:Cysteine--tRNA ligase n=1 Tax=Striga asiatica TaxID=4170 RepID=A0A5A7P9H2_STRAF|nr:cysteine--tRNA ligase [Striga asiatica]
MQSPLPDGHMYDEREDRANCCTTADCVLGKSLWGNPRHHPADEVVSPWSCQSEALGHVDFPAPLGQPPVKALHHCPNNNDELLYGEQHPRAAPPARPERQELKVLPLDVYGAPDKPLGPELHWVLPVVGVPPHGPDVDEKEGVGRDGVPPHHRGRLGQSDSSTSRSRPTTWSISFWAFLSTSGLLMSSAMAHSVAMAVVSVPANQSLEMFSGKVHLRLAAFHHIEEHIQKIPRLLSSAVAPPLLFPVTNNLLQQGIVPPLNILRPLPNPLQIQILEEPDQICHVKLPENLRHLSNHSPGGLRVPLCPGAPNAEHHVGDDVAGQFDELLGADLHSTDGLEVAQVAGAQELVGAELLDVFPVGPIGGECKGGLVSDDVDGGGVLAVGEHDLVGLEELAGELRGGGHDAEDGAQPELEQGAVPPAELVEGLVQVGAQEVEMANDGEGQGAGRERRPAAAFAS